MGEFFNFYALQFLLLVLYISIKKEFIMIRVPVKTWFEDTYKVNFRYVEFSNGYDEVPRPNKAKYYAGDVVVITNPKQEPCVGVVVGLINCDRQELRTDACGMVGFDYIRPVRTMAELKKYPNVSDIIASIDSITANEQRRNENMRKHLESFG